MRVKVKAGSKTLTVRLACIDAPEIKQSPWGTKSTARLKQLLPVGQSVTLRSVETDKYKRLVAEIFVANRSINVNMVQEGQAVVYQQYLKNCPQSKTVCCKRKTMPNKIAWPSGVKLIP
ncbi:thermonuclease family protein [Nostoc sp. CHAB 5844]|nr:thermonuclease family protein [Nostoc sp. CHAB 5844]